MVDHESLDVLLGRQEILRNWLLGQKDIELSQQRHLDAGSAEQAYWHYGYLMALSDIIELVKDEERTSHSVDRTN